MIKTTGLISQDEACLGQSREGVWPDHLRSCETATQQAMDFDVLECIGDTQSGPLQSP